jgi:glutamine cyclotransferase
VPERNNIDFEKVLLYGAVAFVAYLVWKKLSTNLQQTGADVGSALYKALHPDPTQVTITPQGQIVPGSGSVGQAYYNVTFPDGSKHAVDSAVVASDGTFGYGGQMWQLLQGQPGGDSAVPAVSVIPTAEDIVAAGG